MSIKKYLLPAYRQYKYIKYFFRFKRPVGFFTTVWCFFNGFFTKSYVLFGLEQKDRSLYISDFKENFKIGTINKFPKIINNKLVFTEAMSSILTMPDVKGMLEAGKFVAYGKNSCGSIEELIHYIQKGSGVICKPIEGDGGEGIFLCHFTNDSFYWNQDKISEEKLLEALKTLTHYFISDLVQQHAYSSAIYSKSVNTIRIITMKDPVTGEPFLAVAAHRIGNDISRPVDNCAKGGFTANIDLETGILSKAVRTYFSGNTPEWYSNHPDSGQLIEGIQIPHWEQVKSKTLALAKNFSFLEYIGWDIVMLPDGNLTVLEANDGADLKLHQVHEPLLKNKRIKEFYAFHKAI